MKFPLVFGLFIFLFHFWVEVSIGAFSFTSFYFGSVLDLDSGRAHHRQDQYQHLILRKGFESVSISLCCRPGGIVLPL